MLPLVVQDSHLQKNLNNAKILEIFDFAAERKQLTNGKRQTAACLPCERFFVRLAFCVLRALHANVKQKLKTENGKRDGKADGPITDKLASRAHTHTHERRAEAATNGAPGCERDGRWRTARTHAAQWGE